MERIIPPYPSSGVWVFSWKIEAFWGFPALEVYKLTLGGGFKYFLFSPLFGEDFQFD